MNATSPHVTIILGTRPEIIKLAPIIRACEGRSLSHSVIHTGQHYSESLNEVFFDQLELPRPDYNLGVGSASHGKQTGEMIIGIEEILLEEDTDIVLVQGDTNSVLAGTIAATKLDCKVGHVEAGLRSFDRDMPEEKNRVVADHTADCLFAPTKKSKEFLLEEGLPEERIFVTGNTVVDAVQQNRELASRKSSAIDDLDLMGEYGILTAHRAENVDDKKIFENLLEGVNRVGSDLGIEFLYPIHPRARGKLKEFGLEVPEHVRTIPPQDYLDFLKLQNNAELILTDSGGIQEEACILGIPCVTLRENTERPETLEVGANCLSGTEPGEIVDGARTMFGTEFDWENPFGDGSAAQLILDTIQIDVPVEASV
ncbi:MULTISPECIES: non-hydrolyzing UDP-N-acetylglucosamine 2-epimerase [Haloferax]|uniref:non-hydrolyzing UDP-N-acetylglucosamine 2-epimerase n=1 Tax=Haloferax TaxID=2251 RepID=UPI000E2301E9|nr:MULTISPECIES: UDP-N-acetylglucosamine 2-epimerase (non-hydrolyzing) [Haloferax]RDZ35266.1 UDP-N-acetylglucosamine 2-epimerase (non-hydrolyzing) [Haloferax sp. Atlit-24N]RLM35677.1 UDP-N-acetylglucosamine 2-epimerase (non-hydrolyzing) [Haloferax sp. Atlit-109R]RLM43525.1 UDP-N-acetylglucosamine 2-epimerase (non-hydrolyzing) [Haloferax sp. Atlit-105R]WEL26795.1 UDP-N-acetylglucosamine 2-epimerase (non-hydrolyzing) [Haloferax lucentense]